MNPDKLHLMKTLLDVNLSVKCDCNTSEYFNTDTGEPKDDCANANEFTHYLAKSLASIRACTPTDHLYR